MGGFGLFWRPGVEGCGGEYSSWSSSLVAKYYLEKRACFFNVEIDSNVLLSRPGGIFFFAFKNNN